MAAAEKELADLKTVVEEKQSKVDRQGEIVRALKGAKKDAQEVNAAVESLKELKLDLQTTKAEYTAKFEEVNGKGKNNVAADKENIRQVLGDALTRRMFFIPAFKIYGGVAGLYDYGPPGCAVKANVLALWRQVRDSVSYFGDDLMTCS